MAENPLCRDLIFKIICIPDTNGVQEAVTKVLSEYPDKRLISQTFISSPYYKRQVEMNCPECGYRVIRKDGEYVCSNCSKPFSERVYEANTNVKIEKSGVFFVQQLILG